MKSMIYIRKDNINVYTKVVKGSLASSVLIVLKIVYHVVTFIYLGYYIYRFSKFNGNRNVPVLIKYLDLVRFSINCYYIVVRYNIQIYRELEDTSAHREVYHSVSDLGSLHGVAVNAQYQPLGTLDRKRLLARKSSTTYCYDFPLVSTML